MKYEKKILRLAYGPDTCRKFPAILYIHIYTYMRGDVVRNEVLQKRGIVVSEAVLHHCQQVEGWVREVVKPVGTPVGYRTNKSHDCHMIKKPHHMHDQKNHIT